MNGELGEQFHGPNREVPDNEREENASLVEIFLGMTKTQGVTPENAVTAIAETYGIDRDRVRRVCGVRSPEGN